MPLEELLALYGCRGENQENESPEEEKEEEEPQQNSPEMSEPMEEQESEPSPPEEPSKLRVLYEPIPENDQDESRLLRCKFQSEFFKFLMSIKFFYSCV